LIKAGTTQKQNERGGSPEQALRFFGQLYRIENRARDKTQVAGETKADCIHRFGQEHSLPVLNALKTWLGDIASKVVPDTKLGGAVSYTLNQ
jgi:transposase